MIGAKEHDDSVGIPNVAGGIEPSSSVSSAGSMLRYLDSRSLLPWCRQPATLTRELSTDMVGEMGAGWLVLAVVV